VIWSDEIRGQWIQRNAQQRLLLNLREMARYWSRDGRTEIDFMAELDNGTFLFGECKWRTERVTRINDLSVLQAKVASLPEARWRKRPSYILFALGGVPPSFGNLPTTLQRGFFELPTQTCSSTLQASTG
jgi:hypothetical protein